VVIALPPDNRQTVSAASGNSSEGQPR
jgi:hypothetical protein